MGWLPLVSHMCRVLQNGIFCQSLSRHQSNLSEWGKKRGPLQNCQGEGRPRCWCLKCQMLWLRKVWIFSSSTLITTHERAENKNWLFRGQEGDWVAYGSPRQRCANALFFFPLPSFCFLDEQRHMWGRTRGKLFGVEQDIWPEIQYLYLSNREQRLKEIGRAIHKP